MSCARVRGRYTIRSTCARSQALQHCTFKDCRKCDEAYLNWSCNRTRQSCNCEFPNGKIILAWSCTRPELQNVEVNLTLITIAEHL